MLPHLHCIVKCNTINIFMSLVLKWIPDSTEIVACRPESRRFECFAWWRRSQSIRTEGEMLFEVALTGLSKAPVYQEIAKQAEHLHLLGMNPNRIAVHLGVDRATITRALRWIRFGL